MRESTIFFVVVWILMKALPSFSFSSAKYVWPLTDSTYNYEIKSSTSGDYAQCGFHFDGNHPAFTGPPLKLDAYSYPFIDVDINDSNEFKDFSFAMSVYIAGSNGCIFHFKSTTSSGTVTDVSVCIDGTTLTMNLLPDPGAPTPSHSVPSLQGQWVMIQAGRSQSSSTMKFIVSTTGQSYSTETPESYGSNVILGLPGILRIGAKHDNSMALSMMATCITMYDVTTNTGNDVSLIEDQCKSSPPVSGRPATPSTGCSFLLTTQSPTEITSQTSQTTNHISTGITLQTTNEISTEMTSQIMSTSFTTATVSTEPQSTEFTTMIMATNSTTQCNRTELGSSPLKRSGSFILVKENEIFNDPSNLIGLLNVDDKKQCAVACFGVDVCLSFLYTYNDGGHIVCYLYKTFTPSDGTPMLNSNLYVVKCQ